MRPKKLFGHWRRDAAFSVAAAFCAVAAPAQLQTNAPSAAPAIRVLEVKGSVEVLRAGRRFPATPNLALLPGDRLQTGTNSHATLKWFDQGAFQTSELGDLEIPPPPEKGRSWLRLWRGLIYFFHRDKPSRFELRTPGGLAVVLGTEFSAAVAEDGRTTLDVFDGAVELSSGGASVQLRSGERGVAVPGQPPARSPILEAASDLIQWFLQYPAVLDVDELGWGENAPPPLAESVAAYRSGDLLLALAKFPADHEPATIEEKIFAAALLLSVGQAGKCEALLASVDNAAATDRTRSLTAALRTLIAAVKFQPPHGTRNTEHASRLLADSYHDQSRSDLPAALAAARRAIAQSPRFGFAWARVAELEFGFGRLRQTRDALDQALQLSPRHAHAHALRGFVLAAEDRTTEAVAAFEQAISLDGGLGEAWLGRGLCRLRRGEREAGLEDLQTAAALEPQRAVFRSYLGKAFSHAGRDEFAGKEFELAQRLDPNDPTAWLYSALWREQQNRVNDAARDLEHSQELNNHRRLYRSGLLLDQDRAVRGANLARIYEDAGLADLSLREAARAVNADPANFSAHLFLANTYDSLRDPRQFNLRYETPFLSEYLLANLLAPPHAGVLSQTVSREEYSRLFERDRVGLATRTEYLSRGDWSQESAQFGTFGRVGYALESNYRSEHGQRPNNDFEQLTLSAKLKAQLTPRDSVFFQGTHYDATAGDVQQYFERSRAHLGRRVRESQEPLLFAGWHHEWSPASHTLFLGGRLQDTLRVSDTNQPVLLLVVDTNQIVALPFPALPTAPLSYRSDYEAWTAELQQLLRAGPHHFAFGARWQGGSLETRSELGFSTFTGFANRDVIQTNFLLQSQPASRRFDTGFDRLSFYAYDHWQVSAPLLLVAGLSYDRLRFPLNFRSAPNSDDTDTIERLSPKAGFIWTPARRTTVRLGYARALGGVGFDQSFRLEPSQVAGFNQAFRSIIPESAVGAVSGERFETLGLSLEQNFGSGTYVGAQAEWLHSDARRRLGALDNTGSSPFGFDVPTSTREQLRFRERSLTLAWNQLAGRDWSFGARYRVSDAELARSLVDISPALVPASRSSASGTLQHANLFALFQHPCGFFSRFDALWWDQSVRDPAAGGRGNDFWQFNLQFGYRFPQRRAEVRLGLLNLTGRDYRLHPLNLSADPPRGRTVMVSLRFNF